MYDIEKLKAFEEDIKQCYLDKKIRAPIHLRTGYEQELINLFKQVKSEDFIFGYWASHLHCLLKGVPEKQVKDAILDGRSISLCFPEYKIYCSGLVASLAGVAAGVALRLKRENLPGHVWHFCGDMGAECGVVHEAIKYSANFDLPITFVVEDNGVSVLTDTRDSWGAKEPWFNNTCYQKIIRYFKYSNSYPHSGVAVKVSF